MRQMRHCLLYSAPPLLGALCLAAALRAQTPPSAPPPQLAQSAPLTVIRSTTHLVQVNVIAIDKSGQPVSDLTAADFALTDDGKPQKIDVFSLEKSEAVPAPVTQLPPGTFSNRWEDQPAAPTSVTVILLDGVNTARPDQETARQQVLDFFKRMQPQDRVALYAFGDSHGLTLLHDFSSDALALQKSLAPYQGSIPLELDADLQQQSDAIAADRPDRSPLSIQAQRDALGQQADFFLIRRATETMRAIAAIADYLARLPGRKNLIWVSGGFPFSLDYVALRGPGSLGHDPGIIQDDLDRLARSMNSANLAIYPVDARGLGGIPSMTAAQRVMRLDGDGLAQGVAETETMLRIAERTGGRAYYNTNGLSDAVRQALDDARVTYVLGYYPTHGKWDGKFHTIKLQVERPGVEVRYRRGYFALPDETPSPQERQARLDAALTSPLDSTGLRLVVHAAPEEAAGVSRLKIEVHLDARDITLEPHGDRWTGELNVLVAELSADGHNLKGISQNYGLNLKRETYEVLQKQGFVFRDSLDVLPGGERVRVVVRDGLSENTGSVSIPLAKLSAGK